MIDYDGSGVALLIVEKTIVFISIFILMYVGNKRNWKWYRLSETLDKKTYLTRWKWLTMGCFLVFMLNKNLENAFLYITLCVATAVPIYAIMLATIVKRASALRYRQLIIVAVIAFMPIGVILSPCIYGLACLSLYYLPEKDGAACLCD